MLKRSTVDSACRCRLRDIGAAFHVKAYLTVKIHSNPPLHSQTIPSLSSAANDIKAFIKSVIIPVMLSTVTAAMTIVNYIFTMLLPPQKTERHLLPHGRPYVQTSKTALL